MVYINKEDKWHNNKYIFMNYVAFRRIEAK